jgi:hypothetical protein
MKTFSTLLAVLFILCTSTLSAILYLDQEYKLSALFTIISVLFTAKLISGTSIQDTEQKA